jgi:D-amino peptidase
MKILISADMEGISGVVHSDQVAPGTSEYERFRRVMTADVNAAVRGAAKAGADEILVADGHWDGRNILIEELDPRARLASGLASPHSMLQGLDRDVRAVIFVGYHARAGSLNAILDHTWSSLRVHNVWMEGAPVGEIGLNAALCGYFGAPVVAISGDQTACAEAASLIEGIEQAVVKVASGRNSAACLPLKETQERIEAAAERGVGKLLAATTPQPLKAPQPVHITVEFIYADLADRAALLPGAERIDGRKIQFVAVDMPAAYNAFRASVALAAR